jgi:2,4-dienoyl-CoA reductase-like NADH-dependent reductase (Old Yellow Enzyme family)/thioredoxin reductase
MTQPFSDLFSPLKIGGYTIKNRIMNTGHAAHFQTGDGIPTQRYADYVGERAKGGAGIIVTGHTVPHYDGDAALSLSNFDERIVPAYARMAAATHAYDVPLLAQMGHRGRRVSDSIAYLGRTINAPSPVPSPDFATPQLVPHELSTGEVEEIVGMFASAADRAVRGGLDGIELSVGMDYLFANFLHPHGNRRDDKYGGATLEERMTFLDEVVDAVRGELGTDRLLGVRFYDDMVEYSLNLEDYVELAKILEQRGQVDYFNMWQGIVPNPKSGRVHWPSYYYKPGQFDYLPAALKAAVSLPVVGTGRIDSPELANRMIEQGKADIIGLARALIADPHFPNKAKEGRVDDIRTCIACTQSCVGHIYLGMGVGCIYNPVTGREAEWSTLIRAEQSKKVVVVGGGPAGMEAARVAAERGHEVILFDRNRRLGGQVNLITKTPNRGNFEEVIMFFERQLAKLGVDIRLGAEVGVDEVLAQAPDSVIVATGSTPFMPEVIGTDQRHVLSARDVLEGNAEVGERVVVVDTVGRAEAATTADFLADQGRQVEIVTGLAYVAPDMPTPTWHNLMEELLNKKVKLTPFTGVWEITQDALEVYNIISWEPRTIEGVDTVVFGSGGQAETTLYRALNERHADVHAIGDCFQPRDIEVAVVDGHRVAREI